MSATYQGFLASKRVQAPMRGLSSVPALAGHLFGYQAHCVDFALRAGSTGMFLDTGLGKTEVQLEYLHQAGEATNGCTLLLTPLAVAGQTHRRAERWGYESRVIRSSTDIGPGVNICNYDRLHLIDPAAFGAVSLDEGSILKSFTGKTTRALIEAFRDHRFRMVATATPAPNDHMELGQYSEFLGLMRSNEMLMRWFTADQTEMGRYRIKGHGEVDFWDWLASWARAATLPSDLGGDDAGFILPPVEIIRHRAAASEIQGGADDLLGTVNVSATRVHEVKRQTAVARAEAIAAVVAAEPGEPWIIWCDTDYEADVLKSAIPDAVEVRGSHNADLKEERLEAFGTGEIKRLITKPTLAGYGLDWSHCARQAFVGRSYSYETFYQAVRRCQRFGQKRPVKVHVAVAEGENEIGRIVDRKSADHERMKIQMRAAMLRAREKSETVRKDYRPDHQGGMPSWLKSAV